MPNTINDIRFSTDFPQWAKPEQMDVSFVDMSDASVSYSIQVPANIEHAFSLDWWIEVRGERFYNSTLKPNGFKDASKLSYNYTLIFNSERSVLKRYIWVDIDRNSGVPLIKSYLNIFKLTLSQFVDKLNDNLTFYGLSNRWKIEVDATIKAREEQVMVNVENAFLWDVLQQTTTLYGEIARWNIEPIGDKLVIKIGFPAIEINHIFEYGGDTPDGQGGLVKIERSLDTEKLTTILAGRGGERNIPERYFESAGDNFPGDPDANTYTASLNLKNLMPKCFRDYNRGWNSKKLIDGESKAYNQGVLDAAYRPIEWITSERGTRLYGDIWDRLEPKEEIFPTIQGITAEQARASGVATEAVGRLDELIAVEQITGSDDPTSKEYKNTFDIWIKDIGFDLRQSEYWSKDEMAIVFTSGWLGVSEDYEFKIAGVPNKDGGYKEVYVYPDTSRLNDRGEKSAWRLSLMKIDAELDATGKMLPNTTASGNTIEGDTFFFINIQLPHTYVLIAEKRQEDYLSDTLSKVDYEVPIYSVEPDKIFCATFAESDKLNVGAIVRIANSKLINDVYEVLHLQSITLRYNFKEKILPDWSMVVTDKLFPSLNPVQRLSSNISNLTQGIGGVGDPSSIIAIGDKRWLRKDGTADLSQSSTNFRKDVSFHRFTKGQLTGTGGSIYQEDGKTTMELDSLRVRREMYVNELIIDQTSWIGGRKIFSMAAIEDCTKVEDIGTAYRCYFDTKEDVDTKEAQIKNHFVIGDQAYCQRFDPNNSTSIVKYYWRLVVGKGEDYIDLSKTDADGSGLPGAHDDIIQIGNRNNILRQYMYEIDVMNGGSTYTYAGINSFSFENKRYIGTGVDTLTGEAFMFIYGDLYIGSRNGFSSYIKYDKDTQKLEFKGIAKFEYGSYGLNNFTEWPDTSKKIDDAYDTANSAQAAANSANDNANQKSRHFTDATQPNSGMRVGDTWSAKNSGTLFTYYESGWQLTGDNTRTVINGGVVTGDVIQVGGIDANGNPTGNTKAGLSGKGASDNEVRIWAGATYGAKENAPFIVQQNGKLKASNAEISGHITATSGRLYHIALSNDQTSYMSEQGLMFTGETTKAFIGKNTISETAGFKVPAVFESSDTDLAHHSGGVPNIAIWANASGTGYTTAHGNRGNHALYMPLGDIAGFALYTKRLTEGIDLDPLVSVYTCYNLKDIILRLPRPENVKIGKVFYIRQMNGFNVKIKGGTPQYPVIHTNAATSEVDTGGRGATAMFINDGQFWSFMKMGI